MADQLTQVLGIVAIKNMGEYNSQTNYEKLNVVTYQGSSYCAKQNCKGVLPTNTDYWQLYAEKGEQGDIGPQGPKPVKGVDYYTEEDRTEFSSEIASDVHDEVIEQVGDLVSATPLAVSSISSMTDTSRIYVNTTDGYWYYYNGSNWVQGGIYQAAKISDNSITGNMYKKIKIISMNHFDKNTIKPGYISSSGTINDNQTSGTGLNIYSDFIEVSGQKVYISPFHNVIFYNSTKTFLSGTIGLSEQAHDIPEGCKYIRISAKSEDLNSIQVNFQSKKAPFDNYKFIVDQTASESDAYFREKQLLQENIKGFNVNGNNIFNKYNVINGCLSDLTGDLMANSFYYSDPVTSGFIEVEPSTNYSKGSFGSHFTQCYYNSNKEFISSARDASLETPANCKYIRVSFEREAINNIYISKKIPNVSTPDSPFTFFIDGLREEKYNYQSTFYNPITDNEINFDNLIKCKTSVNEHIITKYDDYTSKPYMSINEDLTAEDTVRNVYIFKVNKKVCNLSINCKTLGNNNCALSIKFYNKNLSEIYSNMSSASVYPLTNIDWNNKNFRFLIPEDTYYVRIAIIAYVGSALLIRNLDINFSNKAIINANNNLLSFCGHQGMNFLAPKNTIPSFEYAVAAGMDQCVINVNWTSDNEIVCLHDDTIDATSDGTGNIHNMTYEQALQYDYGSWFNTYYTGTKIPKLEEVLKLFAKAGIKPVIRWNDGANSTITTKIFNLLKKFGFQNNVTIIGFNLTTLSNLRTTYPEYKYGYCGWNSLDQTKCTTIKSALGENCIVDYNGVPSVDTVKLAHDNGLIIGCWFINTINDLYNAINNGADYIKTDIYALQNCDI